MLTVIRHILLDLKVWLTNSKFIMISFVVGVVELTLELTATRIIAPYIGLTIYVWTSVIGVILAALAGGYIVGGRLADSRKYAHDISYLLLIAAISMGLVNSLKDPLLQSIGHWHTSPQILALSASVTLFALPTLLLGTISPYLARLHFTSLKTSGTKLSSITASGTFGALFGTFFTGFYLFGAIGTRNILTLLGLILVCMSFAFKLPEAKAPRILLSVLAILCCLTPSALHVPNVIHDFDTAYNRYSIIDDGTVRALQGDSRTWQSGINTANPTQPVFQYIRTFADIANLTDAQSKYLVVGGGTFTLPAALSYTHPRATTDVVEIDKALLPISKQYFEYHQTDRTNIISEDGRYYLNQNHTKYDLIYLDAFSNSTPPFQLLTSEAIAKLSTSLTSDGLVAVNIFSSPQGAGAFYTASIERTYRQIFPHVQLFQIDRTVPGDKAQNIVLVASRHDVSKHLQQLSVTYTDAGLGSSNVIRYPEPTGKILTDDYAPVEQLSARQF